jgi:hypothetical protein
MLHMGATGRAHGDNIRVQIGDHLTPVGAPGGNVQAIGGLLASGSRATGHRHHIDTGSA